MILKCCDTKTKLTIIALNLAVNRGRIPYFQWSSKSENEKLLGAFSPCNPLAQEKLLRNSLIHTKTLGAQSTQNNP